MVDYTHEFNSANINTVKNCRFDTVYVAAPTGNRLWANANAEKDIENIQELYSQLRQGYIDRVILVGTVDSILRNHVPYGHNRSWFEHQLTQQFNTYTLRLGALIHPTIKKNVLYDLKHGQYLDNINLNTQLQWYNLDNLHRDICFSLISDLRERNLVSEPIFNWEIAERFFPDYKLKSADAVNQSVAPYSENKEDIFQAMGKYLNV